MWHFSCIKYHFRLSYICLILYIISLIYLHLLNNPVHQVLWGSSICSWLVEDWIFLLSAVRFTDAKMSIQFILFAIRKPKVLKFSCLCSLEPRKMVKEEESKERSERLLIHSSHESRTPADCLFLPDDNCLCVCVCCYICVSVYFLRIKIWLKGCVCNKNAVILSKCISYISSRA